jgi:hypothetical protein
MAAVDTLLARVGDDWSVFDDIAHLEEQDRRRVLRSHRERPFSNQAEIDTRKRLDDALDRLMLLEAGCEVGLEISVQHFRAIPALRTLFNSASFVRYIDAYLALSVRFVAARLHVSPTLFTYVNELPVARPYPPPIQQVPAAQAAEAVERLLELKGQLDADLSVREALDFLDDYVRSLHEPHDYELWLRGLGDGGDPDRFARITRGLLGDKRNEDQQQCRQEPQSPQGFHLR